MDDPKTNPKANLPHPGVIRPVNPTWTAGEALPVLKLQLQPGGYCVELTRTEVVVGRSPESDLRLPLPDVSRRHCRFVYADGHWQLHDLQSMNGTFVNDERIQKTVLANHDLIRIGGFTFLVKLPTPAARPANEARVLKNISDALPHPGDQSKRAS
jgi:pSer/pThr/pTyr-binding forkhead associated (FHA) protein